MSIMAGWILAGVGALLYIWAGIQALRLQRGVKISYTRWPARVPARVRIMWFSGMTLLAVGLIILALNLVWWDILYFAALIAFMSFMVIASHNRIVADSR